MTSGRGTHGPRAAFAWQGPISDSSSSETGRRTRGGSASTRAQVRAPLPLLAGLALLPLLLGLNNELENPDATQYAQVAQRIRASGDWLHFEYAQGPFVNKPPLALWAEAVSMGLFGPHAWAARLPSLLAALALVWLAFQLGLALFDRPRAELGAVLVASMVGVQQSVADPKVDWALAVTTAAAVLAFVRARQRPALHWLAWGATGLAVLAKGPLGLCLVGAAIAPEAVRRGWFDGLGWRRAFVRAQVVPGLAIVAAMAAPFYWAVYQRGGSADLGYLLFGQSFGRLSGTSYWKDSSTHLFFLHTSLWVFLPATPLLLPALGGRLRGLVRARALPPNPARVLVWWLVVPLLVFSFSSYKLPQYIYPLAVPAALLSADLGAGLSGRALAWARGGLAALGVAGAALSAVALGVVFPIGWAGAITMSIFALLLVVPGWRVAGLSGLAVTSLLGLELTYQLHFLPSINRYQLGETVGELVRREDPAGRVLPFVSEWEAPFSAGWCSGRREVSVDVPRLAELVRAGQARVALVPADQSPDFGAAGLQAERLARLPDYRVTMPRGRFLDPATREQSVNWWDVVRLTAR